MKKLILALALLVCVSGISIAESGLYQSFNLNATTIAASTTNSTAGTAMTLRGDVHSCRILVTAQGDASTTNGTLVIKFATASGDPQAGVTNSFDTASTSAIKLTMSTLGNNLFTTSDRFDLTGVRYIRVGQMENTFLGQVSNLVVQISYPKGE